MAKFREIIVKSINVQTRKYTDINDQLQDFLAHEIYLVPKEDGEHERYVVDKNGMISKQYSGASGDYIPLSGTEGDKPLSGEFIMTDNTLLRTSDYGFRVGKDNGRPIITTFYSNSTNSCSLQSYVEGFSVQLQRERDTETTTYQVFQMIENESRLAYNSNHIIINNFDIDIATHGNNEGVITKKGININSDGITLKGVTDADGDPAFTKQLVAKDDGTIGYDIKPSEPINIDIHIIDRNLETGDVTIGVTVNNVKVPNSVWGQPPPEEFKWEANNIAFIGNDGVLSAITDIPLNNPSWGSDYKKVSTQIGANYCLHFSIRISGGNVSYYDSFGSKAYRVGIRLGDKFVTTTVMYKPF